MLMQRDAALLRAETVRASARLLWTRLLWTRLMTILALRLYTLVVIARVVLRSKLLLKALFTRTGERERSGRDDLRRASRMTLQTGSRDGAAAVETS
jgi:hypothetical protein